MDVMNASLLIPAMICYYAVPNAYMNEHAREIRGLYDGFFFGMGSWEGGVSAIIGVDTKPPTNREWLPLATQNIAALRAEGITENFLGVSFNESDPWPSSETLLSDEYTAKMNRHFAALGRAAKAAGFRGVSIDVEYPYPRYSLDHPIYTYQGYTPGDLMAAAYRQGRASMSGVLDEFPEAVVFVLPGSMRSRPIVRQFMLGMLDEMAHRNAPGGFHLTTEYAYCLHDPVTQAAIPRFDDAGIADLVSPETLRYWRERCTMAPGVWATHMIETGGEGYPVQPWAAELRELKEQLAILRSLSKRYTWSFSGQPLWVVPTQEIRERYHVGANYPEAETFIPGWHAILRDRTPYEQSEFADPRMLRLFRAIREFDEGTRDADGLCDAFGTPGQWWVLGPLGNPHLQPARAAQEALSYPISQGRVYYGRDGAVRWFPWSVRDPRGVSDCRSLFGHLATDDASAHFVCWIHSDRPREGVLHTGWDDGIVIRVGDEVVFDRPTYPPVGHGQLYRDKYQFEEHVPITIPAGATRLAVTCINAKGSWIFTLRITDRDGYPFEGVRFSLSESGG